MKAASLCYHDIVTAGHHHPSGFPGASADSYKLERSLVSEHFLRLAEDRRIFVGTTDDLLAGGDRTGLVLLTFDDGGISAVTHTADLLEAHGWRGHFFITANMIGEHGFVSASDIRSLRGRGHLIGSHSWSHPLRISKCEDAVLDEEWCRSIGCLNDILGEEVHIASVPGGFHSVRVARAAAAAGVRVLFNSEPVKTIEIVDRCLIAGRFSIQRHTSAAQASALASPSATREQVWQYGYWNLKKIVKITAGNAWLSLRESWWRRFGDEARSQRWAEPAKRMTGVAAEGLPHLSWLQRCVASPTFGGLSIAKLVIACCGSALGLSAC